MHSCPECGSACYCNGDIDDIELDGGADACVHVLSENCDANLPDEDGAEDGDAL